MFKHLVTSCILSGLLACMAAPAQAATLTKAALESWLDQYGAAWEARDAAAAGRLFAVNARYYETPFDDPKKGRAGIEEYWRTVTANQRDVQFESQAIAVNGNTGVAHWSVKLRLESTGQTLEMDGIFVLEFDDAGLCSTLREWWHLRQGQ